MTRETKVGLVVTSSFLFLVGVVIANKWKDFSGTNSEAGADSAAESSKTAETLPPPLPVPTPSGDTLPVGTLGGTPVVDASTMPGRTAADPLMPVSAAGAPPPLPPLDFPRTGAASTDLTPPRGTGGDDFRGSRPPPVPLEPPGSASADHHPATGAGHAGHNPQPVAVAPLGTDPLPKSPEPDPLRSPVTSGASNPSHNWFPSPAAGGNRASAAGTSAPSAPLPEWGSGTAPARSPGEPPFSSVDPGSASVGTTPGAGERKPEPAFIVPTDTAHSPGVAPSRNDGVGSPTAGSGLPSAPGTPGSTHQPGDVTGHAAAGSGIAPAAGSHTPSAPGGTVDPMAGSLRAQADRAGITPTPGTGFVTGPGGLPGSSPPSAPNPVGDPATAYPRPPADAFAQGSAPATSHPNVRPIQLTPPSVPVNPASSGPQTDHWDEQTVIAKQGDTFESISRTHLGTDKYAQALKQYNRDHPMATDAIRSDQGLQAGQPVHIPEVKVLHKRYPSMVPDLSSPGGAAPPPAGGAPVPVGGAPAPIGGAPPPVGVVPPPGAPVGVGPGAPGAPVSAEKTYRVRAPGEKMYDIAVHTMRDGNRWFDINKLNPGWDPAKAIPGGTDLRLPGDAQVEY